MTRQDTAHLAFKIAGLYCLIESIKYVGWIFAPIYSTPLGRRQIDLLQFVLPAVSPVLLIALGSYLLARAPKIAARMFPGDASDHSPKVLAFHALAFSVLAVFLIIDAVPALLSGAIGIAWSYQQLMAAGISFTDISRIIVSPLLKLVLGLALFFGSHGLVRIWSGLRYAGIREKMGLCKKCGYDLSGNTSGVCPECGTPRTNSGRHSSDTQMGS